MQLERSFGETIKKLREDKGLTLREVAAEVEVNISTLAKIEKNHRKPNESLVEKLASFFNVSDKLLKIEIKSDNLVYQLMEEEDFATEILKVAEEKVQYILANKTSSK